MKKIILTGCKRYNHGGELFLDKDNGGNPEVYVLDDKRADYLLQQFDISTGYNFFEEYKGDAAGAAPKKADDDGTPRVVQGRGPRPKQNERKPRGERSGLRRPGAAAVGKDGSEDADPVTV
jgi:hypothetical protein